MSKRIVPRLIGAILVASLACEIDNRQFGDAAGSCVAADSVGSNLQDTEGAATAICAASPTCNAGDVRCSGSVVESCSDGVWLPRAPCGTACLDGRCTECSGGRRCRDGAVETCVAGFWQFSERCDRVCEGGSCVDVCTEGRLQCNHNVLEFCAAGSYDAEQQCPVACLTAQDGDSCGGECVPSSTECVRDAGGASLNEVRACTEAATWSTTLTACGAAVCVSGTCQPCLPGTRRCGMGGPEYCSDAGQWIEALPCAAEQPACLQGQCVLCEPGRTRCNDNALEVCSESGGEWVFEQRCEGDTPACIVALAACGSCAQGDRQCNEDVVQVCGARGSFEDDATCTGESPDCVDGSCRECDPAVETTRCLSETYLQRCEVGSWSTGEACSNDTPVCRLELGRCGCEENATRCAGDGTPERCIAGAWVRQARCTGVTPVCLAATGQCAACEPGTETCVRNILERCDETGSFQSTGQCSSAQRNCGGCDIGGACNENADCRSGACLNGACAVCLPGMTQCLGITPRTCAPDGNWVNAAPCAGERPICVPQTASCICQEGSSVCSSSTHERRCSGGELVESSCPADSVCQGNGCQLAEWTLQLGGSGPDQARSVHVDRSGSVLVAGFSAGALPGMPTINDNAFVARYDLSGRELWMLPFGTAQADDALSVTADPALNVIVAGQTSGTLAGQIAFGAVDAFITKSNPNGEVVWTHQFGTPQDDFATAVAADSQGNLLAGGRTFGPLEGDLPLQNSAAFVRKYTSGGQVVWTRQFDSYAAVNTVAVDGSDNVLVAGYVGSALPNQQAFGNFDAFVRKYDPDGQEIWTVQLGSSGEDYANSIAADVLDNVIIAGFTNGILPMQQAHGGYDAFVSKYDPTGTLIWTRQFGTAEVDDLRAVSVDTQGNVFVVGRTGPDAFVRKLDSTGTERWLRRLDGPAGDVALGVDISERGGILVSGVTDGALPGQRGFGSYDAFVLLLRE